MILCRLVTILKSPKGTSEPEAYVDTLFIARYRRCVSQSSQCLKRQQEPIDSDRSSSPLKRCSTVKSNARPSKHRRRLVMRSVPYASTLDSQLSTYAKGEIRQSLHSPYRIELSCQVHHARHQVKACKPRHDTKRPMRYRPICRAEQSCRRLLCILTGLIGSWTLT